MKYTVLAVVMAALFTGLAAHPAINGWEILGLKGRVKEATLLAYTNGRYHFDTEGLITRFERFRPVWDYETGVMTEEMKIIFEHSYARDKAGRVVRMTQSSGKIIVETTEFFYDDKGTMTRSLATILHDGWTSPFDPPAIRETWWNSAGDKLREEYLLDNALSSLYVWEYDAGGLLVRESVYYGVDEELEEQSVYEYDSRRQLTRLTRKRGDNLYDEEIHTYEYNADGRVSRMSSDDGYRQYQTEYEYVANGLELTTLEKTYDVDMDLWEEETVYEKFDKAGNRLERDGYSTQEYGEFVYYEN